MENQTENISTMALLRQVEGRISFLSRQITLHRDNIGYVRYLSQQLDYASFFRVSLTNYIAITYDEI